MEWSTAKRREPESEHGAQIAIRRRRDDALFQAADRLVHEQQNQAVLQVSNLDITSRGGVQQPIHKLIRQPRRSTQVARKPIGVPRVKAAPDATADGARQATGGDFEIWPLAFVMGAWLLRERRIGSAVLLGIC